MADPSAEVRIRLIVDDASAATTAKIQESLAGVESAAKKANAAVGADAKSADAYLKSLTSGLKPATDGFSNMKYVIGGTLAAVATGVGLVGTAVSIADNLAHEAFSAALAEGKELKKVSTSLMLMAGEGTSLNQIKSVSKVVHDELEDTAVRMGVSSEAMHDAFQTIAERSNKSVGAVQKLTEAMANAGKASSSGLGGLSEGFAQMETGVIRARNPVVQLVAATGLLHGNAKSIAAQMQKMAPDKALELGEKAVEKMSEKMKGLPLGFGALKQSMSDIKTQVMEQMGEPILKAVTTELRAVQQFFVANQGLVTEYAVAFGNRIGEFIKFVSDFLKTMLGIEEGKAASVAQDLSGLIEDFGDRWDEIKNDGASMAKAMHDVVVAAEAVVSSVMTVARMAAAVVTGGLSEHVLNGGKKAIEMATGTGSFKTKGSLDDSTERALHKLNRLSSDMNTPIDKMAKAEQKFRDAATAAGLSADEIKGYIRGALDIKSYATTSGGGEAFQQAALKAKTDGFGGAAADFVLAYQAAVKAHNAGAQAYAEGVFEKSKELQFTLLESGVIASGAMEGFGKSIKNASLAAAVGDQMKLAILKAAGQGSSFNMNGGQTFNLKQDFRDSDPDRIFMVFKRDVSSAAAARTQARGAIVNGA